MPSVQILLKDKISQRFPMLFLICDFLSLMLVIILSSITVANSVHLRGNGEPSHDV
jgi:hypothetical protein